MEEFWKYFSCTASRIHTDKFLYAACRHQSISALEILTYQILFQTACSSYCFGQHTPEWRIFPLQSYGFCWRNFLWVSELPNWYSELRGSFYVVFAWLVETLKRKGERNRIIILFLSPFFFVFFTFNMVINCPLTHIHMGYIFHAPVTKSDYWRILRNGVQILNSMQSKIIQHR